MADPQLGQPTVHVTGTNGKGSTVRMVTALLAAHNLVVGTYTSPDLERVNERLSRNGEPIDDDAFAEAIGAIAADDPEPELQMAGAVIVYLAHRRDEMDDDPADILRLAARAEYDSQPPEIVEEWLADQGVSL
jgi:hypothetical protein